MVDTRRVVTVDGKGAISVVEEPVPTPQNGEVLVDVEASLITPGSGAEPVRRRRNQPDSTRAPSKRGYQAAGVVDGVGGGVKSITIGDRVACMGAGYAYHADAVVVPQNLCVILPDGVSFAEGAFNHLAATGMHAVRRADVALGEYVAVMGLGLVGQLTGQLAALSGGRVVGIDLLPGRVEVARTVGFAHAVRADDDPVASVRAFTDDRGIDCGIVAFGGEASDAFDQLVRMTKTAPDGHRYGRVVVVGGAHIEAVFPTALGNMDVRASSRPGPGYHDDAWERGADYPDTYRGDIEWTTQRNLTESVRLIDEGRLDVASLITHRFRLADASEGYDMILDRPDEALGIILEP